MSCMKEEAKVRVLDHEIPELQMTSEYGHRHKKSFTNEQLTSSGAGLGRTTDHTLTSNILLNQNTMVSRDFNNTYG